MTTTSGPAWWASAFGTIIDGAGAVWVPAGCYDLCTLFKADSDFGSGRLVVQSTPRGFVHWTGKNKITVHFRQIIDICTVLKGYFSALNR